MSLVIDTKIIKLLWWLFAPFLVAKIIILSLQLYMNSANSIKIDETIDSNKFAYKIPKFFQKQSNAYKVQSKKRVQNDNVFKNVVLKAAYIEKNKSFIILSDKSKTVFLDLNSNFKEYKLVKITINSAKFQKDDIVYELQIIKDDSKAEKKKSIKTEDKNVDEDSNYKTINRNSYKKYITSPKTALRDVRFSELRDKDNFEGLKISFVRKGSFFEKLGLKKGDLIKSVDGKELNSVMDLLPYYNNIQNITTIELGLERNGEFKEFIYEIN